MLLAAGPGGPASAQEPAPRQPALLGEVRGCPAPTAIPLPSVQQRSAAARLISEANQAAILGDDHAALDLFRRAAALDPTDASVAYRIGRLHEELGEPREAAAEYCRYLALAPTSPEAAEVAAFVARFGPAETSSAGLAAAQTTQTPQPRQALRRPGGPLTPTGTLVRGLVVPGLGQFHTRRPALGALFLGAAGAAVLTALREEEVTKTAGAYDPFGNYYEYEYRAKERPGLGTGLGLAAAITLAGAAEAYLYARRADGVSPPDGSTAFGDGRPEPRVALQRSPEGLRLELGVEIGTR